MDTLPLSNDAVTGMVAEARHGFEMHAMLFNELAADASTRGPMSGGS